MNQLFGDIVKVTPSSKVVGDMALFLFTRGIKPGGRREFSKPARRHQLPGERDRHARRRARRADGRLACHCAKNRPRLEKAITHRPGERAEKIELDDVRAELAKVIGTQGAERGRSLSHLMYPQVFADFAKFRKAHGDVSVLPTPAYFYGLRDKEEINVNLEEGKTLFARLLNITEPDQNGQRTAIFELNGYPRHARSPTSPWPAKSGHGSRPIPPIPSRSAPPCPAWSPASRPPSART